MVREQLVALLASHGLLPCTIDHEDGLTSAADGEYEPRWPAVIAARRDIGARSLTVVSQNTSSFVAGLRDPMAFLSDGEERLLGLIDQALQPATVTDLWCTYRIEDLRQVAEGDGTSVGTMLSTIHQSHDRVVAWTGRRWDVCEDAEALLRVFVEPP